MNTNVGGIDRILRAVVGVALVSWVALFDGPIWAWIGVLPLLTAAIGWCPPYALFGFSTCKTPR